MNCAGIVVEYNPLHNGHIYHLNQTKAVTGCDGVIAVMSGNFVQRGEPSFLDKWTKTRLALLSGVDLVIELPVIYALSSAEAFAYGSISSLNLTGVCSSVCFGSECADINALKAIAKTLSDEPEDFKTSLKGYLSKGISFPEARIRALCDIDNVSTSENISSIMSHSNNILAVEYLKALYKLDSKIEPHTIRRIVSKYNDSDLGSTISSATAIRKNLNTSDIKESLPEYSYRAIKSCIDSGHGPVYLDELSDIILYSLRRMNTSDIAHLLDVSEGLENRIKYAAEEATNVRELINMIKNKRFTETRIQRILMYSILGITKDVITDLKQPPKYLRVLGFNSNGQNLLGKMRKTCPVPLITNPSPKESLLMKHDLIATDIYSLCFKNPKYRIARLDYKTPPIRI